MGTGECELAAALHPQGVPGDQAVRLLGVCCLLYLNLRVVASLASTTSCESISCVQN